MHKKIASDLKLRKSVTDKIALWITDTLGSMLFLGLCLIFFIIWILWNIRFMHHFMPFDAFPFPILTMIVSLFAIILSIAVLISQNRAGRIADKRQQVEFEVNVHAEKEITKLLSMMGEIQLKLGINNKGDMELEAMKENLDLQDLHDTLNELSEQ